MRIEEKNFQLPTDDDIAVYAYYLWESEGRVTGRELDYWLQAKAHLVAHRQYEAGLLTSRSKTGSTRKAPELPTTVSAPKTTKKRSTSVTSDSIYA
ncbi:MAG: DUF2934 domain-containing protein [Verrucomicrobiota bacterium]